MRERIFYVHAFQCDQTVWYLFLNQIMCIFQVKNGKQNDYCHHSVSLIFWSIPHDGPTFTFTGVETFSPQDEFSMTSFTIWATRNKSWVDA